MGDYECSHCGATYRGSPGHDCPGSDRDRIETLESDVLRLETEITEARAGHANLLRALDAFALSGNAAQLRTALTTLREFTSRVYLCTILPLARCTCAVE